MDTNTSGEIIYKGHNYTEFNNSNLEYSSIYQNFHIIEGISVYANLTIAMELKGLRIDEQSIDDTLSRLGILGYKHEKVVNMSGGEKQRVAIARALLTDSKVMFADEPTGNLDTDNTDKIFALLKEISKKMLVIVATHDIDEIAKYADRIISLQDGKVLLDTGNYIGEDKVLEEKINASTGRLSPKNIKNLAISFNRAKKLRRISFSIVSVILIFTMCIFAIISMLTLDKVVYATFDKRSNSKLLLYDIKKIAEYRDDNKHFTYLDNVDYALLRDKLKSMNSSSDMLIKAKNVHIDNLYYKGIYDIHGKVLNANDYYVAGEIDNIILTDDATKLGIKIIRGKAPSQYNEVAIPSGLYHYVQAMNGIYNFDRTDSEPPFVEMSADELIDYEIHGIKIVGIFDDGLIMDNKYSKYNMNNIDDDIKMELRENLSGNILSNSIISHTSRYVYYNSLLGIQDRFANKYTSYSVDNHECKIMPYNEFTMKIIGEHDISDGDILIGEHSITNHTIGDMLELISTANTVSNSGDMSSMQALSKKNLHFKNVIPNVDFVVVSQNVYDEMSGGDSVDIGLISLGEHYTISDFKDIDKFIQDEYLSGEDNNSPQLYYSFDYSENIITDFENIRIVSEVISKIVFVIVLIVYTIIAYNIVSVLISSKSDELYILKMLGASWREYVLIYGIIGIFEVVFELALGVLIGAGIIALLSMFISNAIMTSTVIIPLDFGALSLVSALVIIISTFALLINIGKISKINNLNQAFNKLKG